VLELVINYMFVRYYVENLIVIFDIGFIQVWNIPIRVILFIKTISDLFKELKEVFSEISQFFATRMYKTYILNPSYSLYWLWKVILLVLSDEVKENVMILSGKERDIMFENGIPRD